MLKKGDCDCVDLAHPYKNQQRAVRHFKEILPGTLIAWRNVCGCMCENSPRRETAALSVTLLFTFIANVSFYNPVSKTDASHHYTASKRLNQHKY